MLGPSREVAPDRFAIAEFLLPHARRIQRSLTVIHACLSLAGLVQEPPALLLRSLEMLCDFDLGTPLPRAGKAQLFGLILRLGLAGGELSGLGEFGGNGA